MARRRRRRKKKNALDYIALPRLDLDSDTKKGIFIVFVLALGAISLLALFAKAGALGVYLTQGLELGFGWGKWLFPVMLLFWGYMLYDEERFELRAKNYIGAILFLLSFQALLFLFIEPSQWPSSLGNGIGGGYVGLLLANAFIKWLGFMAALLVLLGLLIVSILLTFDTSLVRLFGKESWLARLLMPINYILAKIFGKKENKEDEEDEEEDEEDNDDDDDDDEEDEDEEEEDEEDNDDDDDDEEENKEEKKDKKQKLPEFMATPVRDSAEINGLWWEEKTNVEINLPLSLLESKKEKPTSGDIKANKEIIRKALENFGIDVEMGEVSVGPTVTQYTFRPAEGIKLSKIVNLSNDLALVLAAHPIRIEAPIPNKHLVGVEVPNQAKAVVGLKEILTNKSYKQRENNLMIALGKDVSGQGWLDNIAKMPHLLVAGATNSGKSVCLNAIIVSLMYQNNPDDMRFIMVDPKRVELSRYNGIPYLLTPVITDVNKTINALRWCLNEMERRFDVLSQSNCRDIATYNQGHNIRMPYIIFFIDELADLMVAAARDIEAGVIRLAQMARAVGVHLVLATQRPSVDIITGVIKANMPARIAFSVASGVDSRTILDTLGAEKLLGRGDMLFMSAAMSKPRRLQGAFVSDIEIKKIVQYIKGRNGEPNYREEITDRQKVKGIGGVGLGSASGDEDDLLAEAKEIVINMGKASASLLQRKLRVGYARAASILDALEEIGVVGPVNGAKPREILITREQYEAAINQGVSGVSLHDREETEAPDEYLGSGSLKAQSDYEEEDDDEQAEEENKEEWEDEEDGDEEEEDEEDEKDKNEDEDQEEESEEDQEEESEEEESEEDEDKEGEADKEDEDEDDSKYFAR